MDGRAVNEWLKVRKLKVPWLVEQLARKGISTTENVVHVVLCNNGNPKLRNEIGLIIAEYDRIYGYANGTNPN